MADEREQRVVEQKVHLKEYQKDHWVVSLRVPMPARRVVQMMEQLTAHQMVHKMADEREERVVYQKVHLMEN
jgi:hypothetical protein